jgi:hypothetical protein
MMDNCITREDARLLMYSLRSKARRNLKLSIRAMTLSADRDGTVSGMQYAGAAHVILKVAIEQQAVVERLSRYVMHGSDYLILPEEDAKWTKGN